MPLSKDDNFDENLIVINKRINEIKKKIQLSEGQRKAHFEECDAEKKRNIEKIRQLKKEVKEIRRKLAKPPHCDESVLKSCTKYPKDVGVLRNKRKDEAVKVLDYKCIDLNKKLDLLRHQNKTKQLKLKKLADEHSELMTKAVSKQTRRVETVRTKPVCLLENQIHRVEMNLMEADHVNKKYKTIRLHLLSDSVEFESSLRKLEQTIAKQDAEIKHLETVSKEAFALRDITKGTLLRQEISALNAGKSRDHQLEESRHRVEERKMELENLERRIFPPGRAVVHQDSLTGEGAHGDAGVEATDEIVSSLEANFAKLKVATGETDTEEVLHRFLSQRETRKRLTYLKTITEEDKKHLELNKEMNLAELEGFKFAEVKDKEQSQEDIEKMNNAIEEQKFLKESQDSEVARFTEQLFVVREHLYRFIVKLMDFNDEPAPEPTNEIDSYIEVLECLMRKISSGLSLLNMGETFDETLKNIRENEQYKPILDNTLQVDDSPLFARFSPVEESKQQKNAPPSLLMVDDAEEDDIPTRSYLKRQAQLIVDAKSRRKFNRVMNFPRARK